VLLESRRGVIPTRPRWRRRRRARLARPDPETRGQVGLARSQRAQEDDFVLGGAETDGAAMGDAVPLEGPTHFRA